MSDTYIKPSREYLAKERKDFQQFLGKFATYSKIPATDFNVDDNLLDDVNMRVHQRVNYYLYFHGTQLEQTRKAAIKAYWILKYRPIKALRWSGAYDVNVHLAFFVLFAESLGRLLPNQPAKIQNMVVNNILNEYGDSFLRAFNEYDISKEAMMLIADSLKSIFKCEIKYHSI